MVEKLKFNFSPNESKISAVVITYNSAEVIEECIESILWADEIIVLDLGSQDETIKKCRNYTVNFARHPWVPYADIVRDYAAKIATNRWILHIDPDERVAKGLSNALKEITERNEEYQIDVVRIPRKNIAFGRWIKYGGVWPDWQLRFGRKEELHFTGEIHQTGQAKNRKVLELKADPECALIHYCVPCLGKVFARILSYAENHAHEYYNKGERFSVGRLFSEPCDMFYRSFIEKQGHRDGVTGLVFGLLWKFVYPLIINLFLWELGGYKNCNKDDLPKQSVWQLIKRLFEQPEILNFAGYVIKREVSGNQLLKSLASKIKRLLLLVKRDA